MTPPNATEVEVLVQRADWIRALAQALVRDEHEAEDLAQDAWVVALTRHARTSDGWASWIGATMRNLARARWRSERRRAARERDAARPEAEPSNAEMLEHLDAHEVLVRAVRALDEPYRTAILLRYFEGLSPREIAARERVPVKTVDTRLNRALAKLRAQLDRGQRGDRHAWLALLVPLVRPKHAVVAGVAAVSVKLKIAAAIVCVVGLVWWARQRGASRADAVEPTTPAAVAAELDAPRETPVADASQRASVESPAATASGAPSLADDLKHATPPRIAGLVIDATDRPLAGVRVVARPQASKNAALVAETSTDAAGAFELSLADGSERLDVDAPNWAVVLRPVVSLTVGKTHVFVLAPRRRIAGSVVDARGTALADVEFWLAPPRDLRASLARVLDTSFNESWTAQSDTAGAFAFDAAPDLERCELIARAPGFDEARVALAQGDRLDLRVVLADHAEPAKHLFGRVVDARRQPVDGAFVAFDDMAGSEWEVHDAARTNVRGEFDVPVEWATDKPRRLVALAVGFLPSVIESDWDAASRRETWPQPLEFVVDGASLAISGRVVHEDGTPAPGALVAHLDATPFVAVPWATREDGSTSWATLSVEELLRGPKVHEILADKQGRFELGGLLAKEYRLRVWDQPALEFVVTEPIAAGRADVEIRLPNADLIERIAGRVVDRSGQPVPGAHAWLVRIVSANEEGRPNPARVRSKTVTTDGQGGFEFRRISRSTDELNVQAPDQPTTVVLQLAALADLEHIEVTVQRTLRFKIDLTGSAVAVAWFEVLDADGVKLTVSELRGKSMSAGPFGTLHEQGSETAQVADSAATLVLHDVHGVEVLRMPLKLVAGELTIVRP